MLELSRKGDRDEQANVYSALIRYQTLVHPTLSSHIYPPFSGSSQASQVSAWVASFWKTKHLPNNRRSKQWIWKEWLFQAQGSRHRRGSSQQRVIVWKLKVKTTVWKGIIISIIKGLNKRHFKNLLSSSIEYILSTPKILGILTQERTVASLKKFIIKFKQGKQTLTMWS